MHRPLALAALAVATVSIPLVDPAPANAAPVGYTQSTIDKVDLIYAIDVATGQMTVLGDSGLEPATRALTMSPDGSLYGAQDGNLYTFDATTGAATLVGPMGCCGIVEDMTFDRDGHLWALSSNPSHLFAVDVASGAATMVGAIGHGLVTGIASDCDGTLYGTDNESDVLLRIDTANPAASTVVGAFGVDVGSGSLTFDGSGTLWMMMRPAAPGGAASQTRTVDLATGALSPIVATVAGNNPSDLALGPLSCPHVEPDPDPDPDPTVPTTPDTTPDTSTSPTTAGPELLIDGAGAVVLGDGAATHAVLVTPRFTG